MRSVFLLSLGLWLTATRGYYLEDLGEELDEDDVASNVPSYVTEDKRELFIKAEEDWPDMEVFKQLGPISAAVPSDPHGQHTLVLHRADRTFDPGTFDEHHMLRDKSTGPITTGVLAKLKAGKLVGMFLKNRFYIPHGLSVDHEGNVWITDVGLHQVFKFAPDLNEEPLLVLGEKFRPGNDSNHFCKPTHVVVASNGDFFVADGYCNHRILKFGSDGKLITQWGEKPKALGEPSPYELLVPHQLALIEEEDLLCVADREHNRVLCYNAGLATQTKDNAGLYVDEFHEELVRPGSVYGVAFCPFARAIFILVYPEDGEAEVQVYDLATKRYLGSVIDYQQGYGLAHTISTCNALQGSGCLLVSSLNSSTLDVDSRKRRLWFYRMLSTIPE